MNIKPITEPQNTRDQMRDLENELTSVTRHYLQRHGWIWTSQTPGSYWMWVRQFKGVTYGVSEDHAVVITERMLDVDEWIQVTAASHPTLFRCLEMISHDGGAGAGHETYSVPRVDQDRLPAIERALTAMPLFYRQTFAIGDQDEAEKLIEKWPALRDGLMDAHSFLNAFQQGWDHG